MCCWRFNNDCWLYIVYGLNGIGKLLFVEVLEFMMMNWVEWFYCEFSDDGFDYSKIFKYWIVIDFVMVILNVWVSYWEVNEVVCGVII